MTPDVVRQDARVAAAEAALQARGIDGRFDCAMVLGTGLGRIADDLEDAVSVPYADIPHFPKPAAPGRGEAGPLGTGVGAVPGRPAPGLLPAAGWLSGDAPPGEGFLAAGGALPGGGTICGVARCRAR